MRNNRETIPEASEKPEITGRYSTVTEWREILTKWYAGEVVKGYDRYGHPKLAERERKVAELVGTDVLLYNCGMAAIVEALESHHLTQNDVLLYSPDVYGQSKDFIENELKSRGIKCIPFNSGDPDEVKRLIAQHRPKVIFAETVGNAPGMPVLDVDALFKQVEQTNEKYQQEATLSKVLERQLIRRPWIRNWLDLKPGEKPNQAQGEKLSALVPEFEATARKIDQAHDLLPLRDLLKSLGKKGIDFGQEMDLRSKTLELKWLLDSAWLAKREVPITLILDNTLPTPSGFDLAEKLKQTKTPVLAVESGTKLFALDSGTLGVLYSNSSDKMLELKVRRAVTGSYLPAAVEDLLPERTKSEFDVRNKQTLKNTRLLAQSFSRIVGKAGVKAVSHPNLPGHSNYEYTDKHMPEGGSAIFYLDCENSWELAAKLEAKLGNRIEYGGSFGLPKTRLLPLDDNLFRIAGGTESAEDMEEILAVIESIE